MASSFSDQIPTIINIIRQLKPLKILDIGKGFGKYGFLIHEYVGIPSDKKIDSDLTLKEQSNIIIDCVEVDKTLMLKHISHIYRNIFFSDIFDLYQKLTEDYDLILMIDVIEHLSKDKSLKMLQHFLDQNIDILIATPKDFFQQELYESIYENHISSWSVDDFKNLKNAIIQKQKIESGLVFFLSTRKVAFTGFGNSFLTKLKRIRRQLLSEI